MQLLAALRLMQPWQGWTPPHLSRMRRHTVQAGGMKRKSTRLESRMRVLPAKGLARAVKRSARRTLLTGSDKRS